MLSAVDVRMRSELACLMLDLTPCHETLSKAKCRHRPGRCADYRGLRALDDWIASDLAAFRRTLGVGTRCVVVSPNWICDEKLYSSYQRQLSRPADTRWAACRQWLRLRQPAAPSETDASIFCANLTFTAAGAVHMAAKMAFAVDQVKQEGSETRFLDATALTRGRCDATADARHYPTLVPAQASALRRLL